MSTYLNNRFSHKINHYDSHMSDFMVKVIGSTKFTNNLETRNRFMKIIVNGRLQTDKHEICKNVMNLHDDTDKQKQ